MVWVLLLFILINMIMGFLGRHVINFSGFEITPAAITILVMQGSGVVLSAFLLPIAYAITSVYDVRYLWLTIPCAMVAGFTAMFWPNIYFVTLVYHLIGGSVNYTLQRFDTKYVLFIMMNIAANFTIARFYGAMFG